MDSVFESMAKLSLYDPPLTQDIFQKKLGDLTGVVNEIQAYIQSISSLDAAKQSAIEQNDRSNQQQQIVAAQNLEELAEVQLQQQLAKFYLDLRKKSNTINSVGDNFSKALTSEFISQIKPIHDTFQYYAKDIDYRWNQLQSKYAILTTQINSGTWLTYVPSLDNSIASSVTRGSVVFSIQYTDPYLNSIQTLYEKIRNQINEGDLVYMKEECFRIASSIKKFYNELSDNKINPICKKTFVPYFKGAYKKI